MAQTGELFGRAAVEFVPLSGYFGRQDEPVAIGENLASDIQQIGDNERCQVGAHGGSGAVDELTFLCGGANLESLVPCSDGCDHGVISR